MLGARGRVGEPESGKAHSSGDRPSLKNPTHSKRTLNPRKRTHDSLPPFTANVFSTDATESLYRLPRTPIQTFSPLFEFLAPLLPFLLAEIPAHHALLMFIPDASCELPRVLEAYPRAGSVNRARSGGLKNGKKALSPRESWISRSSSHGDSAEATFHSPLQIWNRKI
jgi:hypothetical protein